MNKSNRGVKLNETEKLKTLRDMVMPLFRHKGVVILTFLGVLSFSVFVAWYVAARYYVSEMQIALGQGRTDPAITAAQNAAVMSNKVITPDQISSEIALMKGQDMLRTVA